jgi:crotonobetainyl-CoA:carnitine CoA-transferase CaiB-like acyl-CoA transferase
MLKPKQQGPLAGVRVLEIGHFVAAPFAARLLGDLGADIIKIEPPGGDPVRQWGEKVNGRSLWWSMHGRNKRSVSINLRHQKGRELILELVRHCDILIENLRPGHLDQMGLGPDKLRSANPKLIIAQISGYGQDGPDRDRPAFGVIGEAVGGLRYLTNKADPDGEPPVRVGVSIGDSIAGIYAAFGAVVALWHRERNPEESGLTMDVALSESVLSMMEGMLPEFGALGKVKQPTGSGIATASPSNAYPTADGAWALIAANSDPLFAKLATLMGQPELAANPDFADNQCRVKNAASLDAIIGRWSAGHTAIQLERLLGEAGIPNSKIYTAADCAADAQFRHRGMVQVVEDPHQGPMLHAGIVPHVPEMPGSIRWPGPDVGEHTVEVLTTLIGHTPESLDQLRAEGVI